MSQLGVEGANANALVKESRKNDKPKDDDNKATDNKDDDSGEKLFKGTDTEARADVPKGFKLTEPKEAEKVAEDLGMLAIELSGGPTFLDAGLVTDQSFGHVSGFSDAAVKKLQGAIVSLSRSLQTAEAFVEGMDNGIRSAVEKYTGTDSDASQGIKSQGDGL